MKKILMIVLVVVFVVSMLALGAGCKKEATVETTAAAETTAGETTAAATETTVALSGSLEIFNSWTVGSELQAMTAVIELFSKKNPGVEVINVAIAGASLTGEKPVLATRMTGGDPPDTFLVHGGHELIDTWAVTDEYLEPVNFIFEEEGWYDVFPESVISILSKGDNIYSVPLDTHRENMLWYNKAVLKEIGAEAGPATWDEFFTMADKLKAKGITPLALGDNGIWASVDILEAILISTLGPDDYKGLFDGSVAWDSDGVKKALETFAKILDYVNNDHAALQWDQATQLVIDGTAAMTIQGDWAEGYMKAKGLTINVEFGYAPSPGTSGVFNMVCDTFALPKRNHNRDNVIAFLKVVGSKEGQDVFNPIKGSIPARTDADINLYDEYLKSSISDFKSNAITPSIAHGGAVSEPWSVAINDTMTLFVTDKDVDAAMAALKDAADQNLK